MQTGKSTVKDIFDGSRIFNVPVYQRAYSWRKENLQDFLSDLINQYNGKQYFLGSFLFHIRDKRNDFEIIDIVDGQQRLTTFIIFIRELIKKLLEKKSNLVSIRTERIFIKDEDVFKLELSNEDTSFLHNYILSDFAVDNIPTKTPSQNLLLQSRKFFAEEIEKLNIETLEKIYRVSTEADVLLYVVDEINSATQIFELLNDRGRPLTDLEAIKSFLMYNVGSLSKNPNQLIVNIQANFGEIYRLIEKNKLNKDGERNVSRYHTIAFEGSDDDPKEFIKTKIINSVKTKPQEKVIDTITKYALSLKESFELYDKIQDLKYKNEKLGNLFMIDRVAPFYPVLMKILKNEPYKFDELLENLIKFTFRATLIGLRSNAESPINTAIRNNSDVIGKIKEIVNWNWWNINGRVNEALDWKNYYEYLGHNILKYILFSYENSLRKQKGFPILGLSEYFNETEREKLSIEHITAQKAKEITFDDDFNENYLHNIGNLVIDCKASNSSKGNKNTEDKQESYEKAPLMSQNEINTVYCDWHNIESIKQFITNREIKLKEFIRNNLL